MTFPGFRTARTPHPVTQRVVLSVIVTLLPSVSLRGAQEGDEPPPRFTAAMLLAPAVLQGPHHRVDEGVRTESYFHEFTISSTFGSFEAVGRSELAVRIREIGALADLQNVSKTEVFLAAAGQSVVRIGQSAAAVVTDPTASARGLGAGVKRFGVNLGRRTQRAVASAEGTGTPEGEQATQKDGAGESAAKSVLGVTAATRRWARKVGVDPYTTNLVLRSALEDIAKVDAAGSIAARVAVPIPPLVGMTSKIGELVWGGDPEEVRKVNEQGLRVLAVPDAVAKALFGSQWFTLTYQTRLIAALRSVNVSGVADYVQTAAESRTEREALFFVESSEMLQQWHARDPVVSVLTDSRALVASFASGRVRLLLPLDWISWTAATNAAMREIGMRVRQERRATEMAIVTPGRASELAVRELARLGWTVAPAVTAP